MEVTKQAPPQRRFETCDAALLAAFILLAALGTWQDALLVIDGAVYVTAAWLGNAWDLFFDQTAGRAVATFFQFGLAWALRAGTNVSPHVFVVAAHVFYFGAPLALWLVIRRVEPQPLYSRFYLALALALILFTSEMVAGMGFWLLWLALLADPARSPRTKLGATLLLTPLIVLTHPGIAIASVTFAAAGGLLVLFGRPFPRSLALAAAAMGGAIAAVYLLAGLILPPGNPTVAAQHAAAKYDYIDPVWMLGTLAFFPMLAVLWLLLIAPGLEGAKLRWRLSPVAILIVGVIGLWFAFNGTNSLTWIFARQTAPYVLGLALALALASPPATWLAAARRPLILFAAVIATASVSYTIDLFLFGRAADARLATLTADPAPAPHLASIDTKATAIERGLSRIYFKWRAAPDYVRDVVVPDYGGSRMTFAFYTFFRSDRLAVLYRPLDRRGEWVPFECAPIARTTSRARDDIDRRFLAFLAERYCVKK